MKKLSITLTILFLLGVVVNAGDQINLKEPTETNEFLNLVRVNIQLPDNTSITASVREEGLLKLIIKGKTFLYETRLTNLDENCASMVNVFSEATDGLAPQISFEILEIISIPMEKVQSMALCNGGTCCVTCGSVTACSCGVSMSCDSCCCPGCCIPLN